MIAPRFVVAAVIGGQLALAAGVWAAEPAPVPVSKQMPDSKSAPPAAGATAKSQKSDAKSTIGKTTPNAAPPAHGAPPASTAGPVPPPAAKTEPPAAPPASRRDGGGAPIPVGPPQADAWTPAAIAEAKAHCAAVLKGLDVVVIPEEPIQEGSCGAPAAVKLVSLGNSPEVVLSPAATVTCDMVAALAKWLKNDLQPLARRHLGAPIVKIETMSSYSCRNAYGRAKTNLSEHARANALDIGGFLTSNAETARVLVGWGPTAREIRAQALAAAKAAADKVAADRAAANATAPQAPTAPAQAATAAARTPTIGTLVEGVPGVAVRLPGAAGKGQPAGIGLAAPNHLGGPKSDAKPAPPAAAKPDLETRRTQFLRQAHAAACKHFGTVLGPEANEAHNNHFHLDMAERQKSNFCE